MKIVVNSIIERLSEDLEIVEIIRILWIDDERKQAAVVNINDNRNITYPYFLRCEDIILEIEERKSRLIELETDMRLLSPDEKYLEKYRKSRDHRWNLIKDIVNVEPEIYMPDSRGKLIHEAHLASGKSKKVIRKNLKKYWFYGKSRNGLLDNYFDCGVPSKQRDYKQKPGPVSTNRTVITEADKEIFKSAIKVFHIRSGMNITATHEKMCETFYKRGFYRKYGVKVPIVDPDKSPSLRQFRYWYKTNSSPFSRYSNKRGKRRATMDVRAMLGKASEKAICVGAVFEVDATRSDIILVSFDRKTILGKPTLYIVIDVFSRLVVGYHVSLASESWFEAMVAVEQAATNKVENCARYGIHIQEEDWPCRYLPQNLVGDRGELKSQLSERFVNINVDVLNAPSGRGDLKPYVESNFRITNETIRQLLSGSTEAKQLVRGDYNPARESALTIEEFNRFMIVYILTYNKSALSRGYLPTRDMYSDKVELTPLKVWNWDKGVRLLHEKSRKELRYNLLPREGAKVTRFGIEFRGLNYTCDVGIKEGWFEGIGNGIDGKTHVEISYDPRNCSSIFLKYKNDLLSCLLTGRSKEFEGLHFDEVEIIMEYRDSQIKEQEKIEKQHRAELHAFAEEINKAATKETKAATKDRSFYSRNQDKRQAREADSKEWGARSAMTSTSSETVRSTTATYPSEENIVVFPNIDHTHNQTYSNNTEADIQSLFSRKSLKRRRGDESDE
ncbi:Mu transposase C-terminal domain-containing protein [Paenibacillus popilliae]|uniref:Transposase n=1 Tax=Paenibacillus popilliae TaxID=78057 RepID=A0ABY3AGG5_PAEPP|nr:Mu transposase C-terminal domain-containing protein [Paenibacillus sp. SDF0028]TQR40164.1 transposase [Paenibacillus sp. SDF0028]